MLSAGEAVPADGGVQEIEDERGSQRTAVVAFGTVFAVFILCDCFNF